MTDMQIRVRLHGESHTIDGSNLELTMTTNNDDIIREVARHLGVNANVFSDYALSRVGNKLNMHPEAPYANMEWE